MRQYSLYVTTRQIVVLEIKLYNASEHRLRHTLVADYGTALPLSRQDLHLQASKSLAGRDYQRHALHVSFGGNMIKIGITITSYTLSEVASRCTQKAHLYTLLLCRKLPIF